MEVTSWSAPQTWAPGGDLPGGLTAAEWNAMSTSERQAFIQRLPAQERERLVAEGVRAGLAGVVDLVRSENTRALEQARLDAQERAAREQRNFELERERIRAETERLRQESAGSGTNLTLLPQTTPTTTGGQTPPTQQSVPTWVWILLGLGVVGGGVYVVNQQGGRRR